MASRGLTVLRLGSLACRSVPTALLNRVVEPVAGRLVPRFMSAKTDQLERHIARVMAHQSPIPRSPAGEASATGHSAGSAFAAARRGIGSYGRYWVEFFRLPHLTDQELDRGFSFIGYEKIEEVRAAGYGPILVLPHLGGWEWAAAWLGRISKVEVTAVVERLEPEEVFEWFARLRHALGVTVVPLGPRAMVELTAAVKRRSIICLLSDRDIGGNGLEVDFFGETTTLPVGPALLSRRTGAPILPVAVYFRGRGRVCVVGDPIWPATWNEGQARGRERTRHATQLMANALEQLISQAPDQWHLLEPNWPSDHRTEGEMPAVGRG